MSKRALRVIALFATGANDGHGAEKPKSDKESQAIQAIQKAKTPDEIIAAVENLITKFADTEFKSAALLEEAQAYDQKGDSIKAISSGRLAIEADPKNSDALLLVGAELAQHTRDTDLDKTEKLAEAEKDVNAALEVIPDEPKPAPPSRTLSGKKRRRIRLPGYISTWAWSRWRGRNRMWRRTSTSRPWTVRATPTLSG